MTADDDDDPAPGLLDAFFVHLFAAGIGVLTRALDLVTLVRSPRLLLPYLQVWRAALVSSPFPPRTFEKVNEARRRGLALRELVYGETPLFTARRVLLAAGANERSVVVDLMAGRGRALLGARTLGASARGAELLESHVNAVKAPLKGAGIDLVRADGAELSLDDATHVYLTWTCMSERTRERFAERLRGLPDGAVVVTLSAPLEEEGFALTKKLTALYTWGVEPVYVQVRRSRPSSDDGREEDLPSVRSSR